MSPTAGVLTMLTEPALRDEVERVGAAVGLRVIHRAIHAADVAAAARGTWSAAAAVVLDEEAAARCGRIPLPRRGHVIVVTAGEPGGSTWRAAVAVGAGRVLGLPAEEGELVSQLAEAGEAVRGGESRGRVLAVIGGRGGAGASVFAAALAHSAGTALLVDLDPWGGGADLLIGVESAPGLRWPELAPQGGRLAWPAVRAALPRQRDVSVLSGTRRGCQPDAGALDAVLDAGRRAGVTVICDLPRGVTDAAETALAAADLVVLVSPCEVRACASGAAVAHRVHAVNPRVGLVVRGPSPGGLRAVEVAGGTGLPLLASMRAEPRLTERLEHGGLRLPRRSALAAAARRVLAALRTGPGEVAVGAVAA